MRADHQSVFQRNPCRMYAALGCMMAFVRPGYNFERGEYPPYGLFIIFNQIQCILKLLVPVPDHSHGCIAKVKGLPSLSTHTNNRAVHGRIVGLAPASAHLVDSLSCRPVARPPPTEQGTQNPKTNPPPQLELRVPLLTSGRHGFFVPGALPSGA